MLKRAIFPLLLLSGFSVTGCFSEPEVKTYEIYRNTGGEELNLYGTEKNVQGFTEDVFVEIANRAGFKINFVRSTIAFYYH